MNEMEFAQRLRQFRKAKNLTQQELADRLGVSNKSVSRWESGSYPDVGTLVALARALGVTVDELLDPKAPVRTLEKSDWQNLLSFAFSIGGGLLFFLLTQFVPLPVCWLIYLACLSYGIYLQAHYTYHAKWFQLGTWTMAFFVSWSAVSILISLILLGGSVNFVTRFVSLWFTDSFSLSIVLYLFLYLLIQTLLAVVFTLFTRFLARRLAGEGGRRLSFSLPKPSQLRLRRAPFSVWKAFPVVSVPLLAGFWCLYWRVDLPPSLYSNQRNLYWVLWAVVVLLTVLPLLKRGRRGMLAPAAVLAAVTFCFPFLAHYVTYSTITQVFMGYDPDLSPMHYYSMGQPSLSLLIAAVLAAALYVLSCFFRLEVSKSEPTEPSEGQDL